jgi:hypothetical protein
MRTSLSKRIEKKEAAKGSNPIAAMLKNLPEIKQLQQLLEDMGLLRDGVAETQRVVNETTPYMISDINSLIYMNEKQRNVTMRLLHTIVEGPKFVISGAGHHTYTMSQVLELENQYSAEYDGIYAFIVWGDTLRAGNKV